MYRGDEDLGSALGLGSNIQVENVINFEVYPSTGEYGPSIENLRLQMMQHVAPFLESYIWQRETFSLTPFTQTNPPPWMQSERSGPGTQPSLSLSAAPLQPAHSSFLWGSVDFGDNIEDEWFITWLLLELTRAFPVTARAWDNDGVFLLIEAAYVLPKWLKPEVAFNRVWMHAGKVHVVPMHRNKSGDRNYPAEWGKENFTATTALKALQSAPEITEASGEAIHEAIQVRVKDFPGKAQQLMHRSVAVVPAKLAHVLLKIPQSMAPAVETFYYRDPYDVRAARKMTHFPPEDMVKINVRFSKVLYAQLALQDYVPPSAWPSLPPPAHPDYSAVLLGSKLAAGYEMMLQKQNSRGRGDVLELLGKEGVDLSAIQAASAAVVPAETDEWLSEAPAEMEAELERREREVAADEERKQAKKQGKERKEERFDPDELSSKVKAFIDAAAGLEGAEVPPIGSNSGDGFNEERFLQELGKLLGLAEQAAGRGEDSSSSDSSTEDEGSSFYGDDDGTDSEDTETEEEEDEIVEDDRAAKYQQWAKQVNNGGSSGGVGAMAAAAAAAAARAAAQRDSGWDTATDSDDEDAAFMESYDAVLAQQLAGTSLAQTFATAQNLAEESEKKAAAADGDSAAAEGASDNVSQTEQQPQDASSLQPLDIDANLISNLLASYQEQGGLPGPASNLAGLLGVRLPDPE